MAASGIRSRLYYTVPMVTQVAAQGTHGSRKLDVVLPGRNRFRAMDGRARKLNTTIPAPIARAIKKDGSWNVFGSAFDASYKSPR